MRSKLNPDGVRIRVLRIERGWTQEQLAEIAGISPRTVQRAEIANCASFETVRALAGAFEMDFGQLLRCETYSISSPEPQMIDPLDRPGSAPEFEAAPVGLPKTPVRRMWAVPLLSISTLVLGLVAGVVLRSQFEADKEIGSTIHSAAPVMERQVEVSREPARSETIPVQKVEQLGEAPSEAMETTVLKRELDVAAALPDLKPAGQPVVTVATADFGLQDSIQHPQGSRPLELPLRSESLISELLIPTTHLAGQPLVISEDRCLDEPDAGAVRQAVDVAAKKTGTAVSKVRASLKRVF